MSGTTAITRHRLPRPYRQAIVTLWLAPLVLLVGAILLEQGATPALFDPRFLLPLALMALPALYVWQEGVDVLPDGIVARVYWPRYYAYRSLHAWTFDTHSDRRVIAVWDQRQNKVLECRAAHVSDLPALLRALGKNVCYRQPPP